MKYFQILLSIKSTRVVQNVKYQKHWKLSEFHNKDMIIILNKFYINFIKLFDNKTIRRVMEESQRINKIINNLVILTIYFTDNGSEYKDGSTIFNTDICNMLYEYYFLSTFSNIINTIDTSVDLQIKTPSEQEEEKELEESLSGDNDLLAQHILMGQRENTQGKIAELLSTFCSIIVNNKKAINYNYEILMDRVHRAKEKEKDSITDYLKAMTDEEREIENLFKNQKIRTME